jgi:hypothetical protein
VADYLTHDKLAIRQLAHMRLSMLVPEGQRISYDPTGQLSQRERGYEEWRKLLSAGKPPAKQPGARATDRR